MIISLSITQTTSISTHLLQATHLLYASMIIFITDNLSIYSIKMSLSAEILTPMSSFMIITTLFSTLISILLV